MSNIKDCWGIASCPCEDCAQCDRYEADQAHINAPSAFEVWAVPREPVSPEVRRAFNNLLLNRRIGDDFDRVFNVLTKGD